jgi:hypothetical protein
MQVIGPEDQQKLESLVPKTTRWAIVHNPSAQRYFDLYQRRAGRFIYFEINGEPYCGYKEILAKDWTIYDKGDYRISVDTLAEMAGGTGDELRRTMETFF